ncbi:MAG: DUF366 family protein [Planctomycetes bacterium]|nr:DUF366 family protein [Planctomycetota bacterium]
MIHKLFVKKQICYDGSQIESHWGYKNFGLEGDSIISFMGKCDIKFNNIKDLEDKMKGAKISSPLMLHFIIEHFYMDVPTAVFVQRLFACIVKDELESLAKRRLQRNGDDLYLSGRKLTISVASGSLFSSKIHFGINIEEAKDVDVSTMGLNQLKVDPVKFGRIVMDKYAEEFRSSKAASVKVTKLD